MKSRATEWTTYIGTTYFYDAERFHSPYITCIGPNYDDVYNYLVKIRHIQVVDIEERHPVIENTKEGACASITAASFANEESMIRFVSDPLRAPFILEPYPVPVDRHMAGLSKKDAKLVKIPGIVVDIIDRDAKYFKVELNQSIHTLEKLLYYINGTNALKMKISGDSQLIIKACDLMKNMVDEDGYDVAKGIYKRHQIFFCGEHEYRLQIDTEMRRRQLDAKYRAHLDDPYS